MWTLTIRGSEILVRFRLLVYKLHNIAEVMSAQSFSFVPWMILVYLIPMAV